MKSKINSAQKEVGSDFSLYQIAILIVLIGGFSQTLRAQVSVSISPSLVTLATLATQPFTATVSGTTNTAVNWQVNGVAFRSRPFHRLIQRNLPQQQSPLSFRQDRALPSLFRRREMTPTPVPRAPLGGRFNMLRIPFMPATRCRSSEACTTKVSLFPAQVTRALDTSHSRVLRVKPQRSMEPAST
jgi:hypothetical protein